MNGRNKNIDSYYYMIDHYHSLNSFKFKIILVCVDTKLPRLREGILKPSKNELCQFLYIKIIYHRVKNQKK